MRDILADYREWRDQQAARVSTHSGGCHMWHKDCMIHRLADALERATRTPERPSTPGEGTRQVACTLTDAEREALQTVMRRVREDYFAGRFADSVEVAAVIDGLLERTK
jgi:hypothetical protein